MPYEIKDTRVGLRGAPNKSTRSTFEGMRKEHAYPKTHLQVYRLRELSGTSLKLCDSRPDGQVHRQMPWVSPRGEGGEVGPCGAPLEKRFTSLSLISFFLKPKEKGGEEGLAKSRLWGCSKEIHTRPFLRSCGLVI